MIKKTLTVQAENSLAASSNIANLTRAEAHSYYSVHNNDIAYVTGRLLRTA